MALTTQERAALETIESSMARKDFNLANILEAEVNRGADDRIAARILTFESTASAGGSATESMTFTGLLATDTILALTQRVAGAGAGDSLSAYAAQINDGLDVTWEADPGAGAIVRLALLR